MKKITVATLPHRVCAEPLQERLKHSGIQAEIHDKLRFEKFWWVSKPEVGIHLCVPAHQAQKAHNLLLDWDASDNALHDAVRCPECKSLKVDYPQFTRKSMLPNFIMGLSAALGIVEREYYCEQCHYTWPKEGTKRSIARPHMAPYYFIEGVPQGLESALKLK